MTMDGIRTQVRYNHRHVLVSKSWQSFNAEYYLVSISLKSGQVSSPPITMLLVVFQLTEPRAGEAKERRLSLKQPNLFLCVRMNGWLKTTI